MLVALIKYKESTLIPSKDWKRLYGVLMISLAYVRDKIIETEN